MRFTPSIFAKLLEPIKRRQFDRLVERHAGDAYVKSFTSWTHLLALVYAQFSSAVSLRGLEAGWNANRQHHYHLGSGPLVRSTLADASKRRPVAVFAETFSLLASQLDRPTRRDGTAMVKLIDSTPIPLGKLCDWAKSNGRIRGLKMPSSLTRRPTVRASSTSPMPTSTTPRSAAQSRSSRGRPMSLTRAIAIMAGGPRSPTKARSSALYKVRWQIELLFRWIKQHLHIRRFLGNNDNAIRLQLFAAMIAYALLRIAARSHRIKISILRFTDLVALCLFERRHIGAIDKPPPVNPSRPQCQNSQNQLSLSYA
jgi:hypothetical protein